MNEKTRFFAKFSEIDSRPDFDPKCSISPQNVAALVGQYGCQNDDERPCQRETASGICGEAHRNGWLGRRTDGKEALIGRNCGEAYFHASAVFTRERNRVTNELAIDGLIERLTATAGNKAFAAEVDEVLEQARSYRNSADERKRAFAGVLADRLEEMAKSGNVEIVVLHRYEKQVDDENGNPIMVPDWTPTRIASVMGVKLWDRSQPGQLFSELHSIRKTLKEVNISRDAGRRKLQAWANSLEQLPKCREVLADLEGALKAFWQKDNLQWLCFSVKNEVERLRAARIALECAGDPQAAANSRRFYQALHESIRGRGGNRDFRVPG